MNGTNVACLFDLRVCYVFVLCLVRCAEETKSPKASDRVATKREKRKSVTFQLNSEGCVTSDDLNLLRTAVKKPL